MYTVRRSLYQAVPYANLILAGVVLLLGAVAWGIYLNRFAGFEEVEPGVFVASNIPEWHGVVWAYGLVAICILVAIPTHRILIQRWEKKRFREKFRPLPPDKSSRYIVISIVVAAAAILLIQLFWKLLGLPAGGLQTAVQGFIVVFSIVYMIGVLKVAPSHYADIIHHLNQNDSRTSLRLEGNQFGSGAVRIFGRFNEKAVDFSVKMPGQKAQSNRSWRHPQANKMVLTCTFSNLSGGPKGKVQIVDKQEPWVWIRGKDLNDCFRKRFIVIGGDAEAFPPKFKKALLHSKLPINLTFKRESLVYTAVYSTNPPYYSREGIIALWMELLDWFEKY